MKTNNAQPKNRIFGVNPKDDVQFSRRQLAERWSVHPKTVKRREYEGLIRSIKMGRSVRYRLSDILAAEEDGL